MTKATEQPEKKGHVLVSFQYGDPSDPDFIRFTDDTQPQGDYMSAPTMAVTVPANSGVLEDTPLEIDIPLSVDPWIEAYTEDVAREFIWVEVREITRPLEGGPDATDLILFRGLVTDTIQNYQGKRQGHFEALSFKQRLDIPLGIAATHQCPWRLFGRGCLLTQSLFQRAGVFSTINGKVCTLLTPNTNITAPTSPGGNVDRLWERGFVEKDGLQIPIMKWVQAEDATRFILRDVPPPEWVGAPLLFVPGCHKTIEDCRDVWDNEQGVNSTIGGGFGGVGFAMLPYNPLYENGS